MVKLHLVVISAVRCCCYIEVQVYYYIRVPQSRAALRPIPHPAVLTCLHSRAYETSPSITSLFPGLPRCSPHIWALRWVCSWGTIDSKSFWALEHLRYPTPSSHQQVQSWSLKSHSASSLLTSAVNHLAGCKACGFCLLYLNLAWPISACLQS